MRKFLSLLTGLLVLGSVSYGQVASKTKNGFVRTTDSLNETRAGYVMIPAAGKALKTLIDANTSALAGKQATLVAGTNIKTFGGLSPLGSGDLPIPAPSNAVIWAMFGGGNAINYAGNGTFHIDNAAIAILVNSTLRGFSGFDENIANQVLSHTGTTFKWILQSTGTGSTTTTTGGSSALSMRDSTMYYADSTKMRFTATGTTVVNISTVAQLRSFLTTTQTNVRGVLANGTYGDGSAFEQTGTWTNVSLEAANYRQAILENTGGGLVWINQGSATRQRVRLKDFVLRTPSTETGGLAIYHHNELPTWDGLEWDGLEMYHTNPTAGHNNGFTIVPYSEGSKQGKILRNVFIHNCYIHDIPRANEFLAHGFAQDWIYGVVVTNNRIVRMGQNDAFGACLSYSGTIKGIYSAKNTLTEFKYGGIEHVANRLFIDANNTLTNTTTDGGVGIAISDNNLNLTRYGWLESNTVNVMSRPFYAYGVKDLTISGGTYTGRLGADGTPVNGVFKDFSLTVWAKAGQTVYNYVWQFDGTSSGNTVTNVTASSGGTQANSPGGPTAYTIHLTGSTANNTFNNNTTILGKDASGNWAGGGGIVNDGAASNVITNTTTTRVN